MFFFDENATYVVSGGLGTCGRAISEWMVERGAKHLLLLSRSGVAAAPAFVESLRERGAQVEAPPCNVGELSSLRSVLETVNATMPPIKGCIQAAVVVDVRRPRVPISAIADDRRRMSSSLGCPTPSGAG